MKKKATTKKEKIVIAGVISELDAHLMSGHPDENVFPSGSYISFDRFKIHFVYAGEGKIVHELIYDGRIFETYESEAEALKAMLNLAIMKNETLLEERKTIRRLIDKQNSIKN